MRKFGNLYHSSKIVERIKNRKKEILEVTKSKMLKWWLIAIGLPPLVNALMMEKPLPPVIFIKDFAKTHQLNNIIVYSNTDLSFPEAKNW